MCVQKCLYNRIICVTNWVSVLKHTMRPFIIFSLVYDVLIRRFKALLVNKNAKRFNKKAQMKSFSWIDPDVLINSGSAPFLHSLPTACQIIVLQLLPAKPTGLCVQSPDSISSPLTADKRNKHFTKTGKETFKWILGVFLGWHCRSVLNLKPFLNKIFYLRFLWPHHLKEHNIS